VTPRGQRAEDRGPATPLVKARRCRDRTHRRPSPRALRGAATLANDPTAFLLGAPAPHTVTLSGSERMLEARLPYRTTEADGFGHVGLFVGDGVEDLGIEATARCLVAPQEVHLGKITPSKHIEVQGRAVGGGNPPGTEKRA